MVTPLHVLVIGGGIGGLTLAQGLRREGVSVAVDQGRAELLPAIRAYEAAMIDYGFKAQAVSRRVAEVTVSDSRLQRAIFRVAARAINRLPMPKYRMFPLDSPN